MLTLLIETSDLSASRLTLSTANVLSVNAKYDPSCSFTHPIPTITDLDNIPANGKNKHLIFCPNVILFNLQNINETVL